ncbi:RNA polymerase sigma factor [Collinsella tanakaei]|uniref:RNA polymerase sigma factor n=1 Tax=Collinsella tanakaei TaxID=626935 RepID=UPI002659DE43|nr:RNA polymerase sigma factor [Collinsella tanakaei]
MTKISKPIGAKEAAGPALRSEAFMEHAAERHRGPVIRLALARTRSMADAQDIAQNVFIKLLKSQVRFHDDEHLKAWLLRATHDACADLHRLAWRRHVETREDMAALMDQDPADPALEAVLDHPVWIAMGRLPDKLRAAPHLHYVEGYSVDEAAKIMGCLPTAARARLHRGRKKLREELARMGADDALAAPREKGRQHANGSQHTSANPSEPRA